MDVGIVKVSALAVALGVAGLAVIGALMALSLCEDVEPAANAADPTAEAVGSGFSIDPDDARAMHDANLPTRSDVLG